MRRRVRVRRAEQSGTGHGAAGEELPPERFGDDRDFVDVRAREGDASEDVFGFGVVGADDVDESAEDAAGGGAAGVDDAVGCYFGDDVEDVAGDAVFGFADDGECAGWCGADVEQERDDAADGLAAADCAFPEVDAADGVEDRVLLSTAGRC